MGGALPEYTWHEFACWNASPPSIRAMYVAGGRRGDVGTLSKRRERGKTRCQKGRKGITTGRVISLFLLAVGCKPNQIPRLRVRRAQPRLDKLSIFVILAA